jgi:flagellar biosynthesis protein FlhB
MAEEDKDKSENATPFKLEEARKRGQVAKSVDFVSIFVVGALLAGIMAWFDNLIQSGARMGSRLFEMAPHTLESSAATSSWLSGLLLQALVMIAPFLGIAALAAFIGNLVQSGATFSGHPVKPDFQRINPAQGFKRLFSLRALYDGAKTLVKLVALSVVAYLAIRELLPSILAVQQADPRGYLVVVFNCVRFLLFALLLVLCAVGLLDLAYNRWDFGKKMMMSRRELKDEVKRREGDPQIRARIRELQQEMVKRAKSLKNVPDADVLITNPEHFAIALEYDKRTMPAPCVTAKGSGDIAQQMKRVARLNNVPIIENKPLARRLFAAGDLDQPVGQEFFESLAQVFAQVHSRRQPRATLEIGR